MAIQQGSQVTHVSVEQVMEVVSMNSDGKTALCKWQESDGRGERGNFAITALNEARPAPRQPAKGPGLESNDNEAGADKRSGVNLRITSIEQTRKILNDYLPY